MFSNLTMPFGKHKGELLEDLPTEYIEWVLTNVESLNWRLKEELQNQLKLRNGEGVDRGKS